MALVGTKMCWLTELQTYRRSYQDGASFLGQPRPGRILHPQSSICYTNSNTCPALQHRHFFRGLEQE